MIEKETMKRKNYKIRRPPSLHLTDTDLLKFKDIKVTKKVWAPKYTEISELKKITDENIK